MRSLIRHRKPTCGFTLVELLVSMAVLALLMVIIMDMLNRTQKTVTRQQARAEEFKEARAALESISRSLSGAVMNSYWAYGDYSVAGKVNYTRQSDGHFVAGPGALLRGGDQNAPGHAMFFQSSEGQVRLPGSTTGLGDPYNLVTCMGYYVHYDTDKNTAPQFIEDRRETLHKEKWRFRLMELRVPPEKSILYSSSLDLNNPTLSRNKAYEWFRGPFVPGTTRTKDHAIVLAENILALILVPRYVATTTTGTTSEGSSGSNRENTQSATKPAADYYYDSRESQWGITTEKARCSSHQLPPVVQITLVAAEERSYQELEIRLGEKPLAEKINAVFQNKFTNHALYADDIQAVEEGLVDLKLNHRIFTTNVAVRGSKWIVEERNL